MLDLITDAFEVLGLLALAIAAGIFLARYDLALGVAGFAVTLIIESIAVTALAPTVKESE